MASCGASFPAMPVRPAVQGACQRWRASPVVLKHEGLPGSEVSRESSRLQYMGSTLRSEPRSSLLVWAT